MKNWIWVDTPAGISKALKDITAAPLIGFDTEYDSFRYFHDKLCLLQVRAGDKTYLFDPLNGLDLSPLGAAFANPAILKVVHAGENDIRLLKRDYQAEFRNIFDTHRAATLLGCQYLALSTLVTSYLGIEFDKDKKIQRSRWDTRPLSEVQLSYAVRDTVYLMALYEILKDEIERKGLRDEAAAGFNSIAAMVWQEKVFDPNGYRRIAGYATLTSQQKLRLKRLYRWRFQKARTMDRAVFMVLSDKALYDLSRVEAPAAHPDDRTHPAGLTPHQAHEFGREIRELL